MKFEKIFVSVGWVIMKIVFWTVVLYAVIAIGFKVFTNREAVDASPVTFGIDMNPEAIHGFSSNRRTLDVLTVRSCEQDVVSGLYRVVSIVIREGKEIDTAAMANRRFKIGDKVHHVSFVVLPHLGTPKHLNSVYFAIPATNEVAVTNR
jgi:hypothetical protein